MFSVYSVGDGVILQHNVGQMNRLAVKLDDIISATNSHVRSEVLPVLINYFILYIYLFILVILVQFFCSGVLLDNHHNISSHG